MNQHEIKEEAVAFPVYSLEISTIHEILEISFPSKYFILLLAADYSVLTEKEISDIVHILTQREHPF
jgi:hypothetical protein